MRRTPYASGSMRTRRDIPLGFQPPAIGEEEVAAVAETLRSGWLTTGPRAARLEERVAIDIREGRGEFKHLVVGEVEHVPELIELDSGLLNKQVQVLPLELV